MTTTPTTCTEAIDRANAAAEAAAKALDAATAAHVEAMRSGDGHKEALAANAVRRAERAHNASIVALGQAEQIGACDAH